MQETAFAKAQTSLRSTDEVMQTKERKVQMNSM